MVEEKMLNSKDLDNVSGGANLSGIQSSHMVGGPGGIWRPKCPNCGKEMPGGRGVIRISKNTAENTNATVNNANKNTESPYYCTECAEKLLNSGQAVIDPGYEKYYEKYNKSMNETTGEIYYGYKKKDQIKD